LEPTISSTDTLLEVISEITNTPVDELGYLSSFLSSADNNFILRILATIQKLALRLPELFPEGSIPRLSKNVSMKLEFTRTQTASLLANMFFGTMNKMSWSPYWVNFSDVWYKAPSDATLPNPVKTYLTVLFHYFEMISHNDTIDLTEKVTFERYAMELDIIDVPLTQVNLLATGKIGDQTEVEVDFANKDIGFGKTGTQEEILFGMSPEMCIAMLFSETMQDNESIMISGALRVGKYRGYGNALEFDGVVTEQPAWRRVIAIDAVELEDTEEKELILAQLGTAFDRDLLKATCGFTLSMRDLSETTMLGTGHWGCGAFGGNKEIKFLQQWIAASMARVPVVNYYTFGDHEFEEKAKVMVTLEKSTTKKLYDLMQEYRDYITQNDLIGVFDFIRLRFQ
jgi:poly(ADP-ribose) glycohydrolase